MQNNTVQFHLYNVEKQVKPNCTQAVKTRVENGIEVSTATASGGKEGVSMGKRVIGKASGVKPML